jgi:hypothetical protein
MGTLELTNLGSTIDEMEQKIAAAIKAQMPLRAVQ